jgi:hypothetical protein
VSVTIPRGDRHFKVVDIAESPMEQACQERNVPHSSKPRDCFTIHRRLLGSGKYSRSSTQ